MQKVLPSIDLEDLVDGRGMISKRPLAPPPAQEDIPSRGLWTQKEEGLCRALFIFIFVSVCVCTFSIRNSY